MVVQRFNRYMFNQVCQDMEATLGEDAPSYNMGKKWAGKFKLDRNSLEDNPRAGNYTIPHFLRLLLLLLCCCFSFAMSKRSTGNV